MPQALFISKEVLHSVVCTQFLWHLLVSEPCWVCVFPLNGRRGHCPSVLKMQPQHCWKNTHCNTFAWTREATGWSIKPEDNLLNPLNRPIQISTPCIHLCDQIQFVCIQKGLGRQTGLLIKCHSFLKSLAPSVPYSHVRGSFL